MIRANFTAQLHCQHGQIVVADTALSDHPFTSADEDGWLCTEAARNAKGRGFKKTAFSFRYIEHTQDRTHYHITCAEHWDYSGARLERNRNGWLGLYGTHVVGRLVDVIGKGNVFTAADYWKIETLQPWDGNPETAEHIDFYLRDRFGQRVAQSYYTNQDLTLGTDPFLNAGQLEGEVLTFRLRDIQLA